MSTSRQEALQILKENGIRRTDSRVEILSLMLEEGIPMEAREIFTKLSEKLGDDAIWLSTVYRNLEAFEEKGLVHKVRMPDSDSIFYHLHETKHKHYAICRSCRKELPLPFCYLDELSSSLKAQGFVPKYHSLEVFGLCQDCYQKLQAEDKSM